MATMMDLINQGVLNMQGGGQPPSQPVYTPPPILNPAGASAQAPAPSMSMPQVATVQSQSPTIDPRLLMPLIQQAMESAQQQSQTQDPLILAMQQRMLAQPRTTLTPAMARMQAFAELNKAMPGKGPISNLVNPLVAALMARSQGAYLQQKQQDAADLQRMKVMAALGQYQANMAKANKGITGPLGVVSELIKSGVLQGSKEQTQMAIANAAHEQSASNVGFTQQSTTNRAKMIQDRLDNRTAFVQSEEGKRKVQEINAAMDRTKLEIKAANERLDKQLGGEKAREEFRLGVEQDNKDREYRLKVLETAKNWTHLDYQDQMAAANFQVAFENMKTGKERLGLEKVNTENATKNMLRLADAQQREDMWKRGQMVLEYAKTQPQAVGDQIVRDQLGPSYSAITGQAFPSVDPQKTGYAWVNMLRIAGGYAPALGITQGPQAPPTSSVPSPTAPAWMQPPQMPAAPTMPNITIPQPRTGPAQLPPELANLPGMQQFVTPGATLPTEPPIPQTTTVAPPSPEPSPIAAQGAAGVGTDYFARLKARTAAPMIPIIPAE